MKPIIALQVYEKGMDDISATVKMSPEQVKSMIQRNANGVFIMSGLDYDHQSGMATLLFQPRDAIIDVSDSYPDAADKLK